MATLFKREITALGVRALNSDPNDVPNPVNVFAVILFMVTLLSAGVGFILFDYTFQVVKTLCIVEDLPSDYMLAPAYDSIEDGEETEPQTPKLAQGLYLGGTANVKDKYITSSFRRTIQYLREEAGFWSAWRGCVVNIVYIFCASISNGILLAIFPFPFGRFIAGSLVMVVVSPLSLVHTHVVMAPPTKETWFGRLARMPFKSIVHTLPASLLVAVTGQAAYAFPDLMTRAFLPKHGFDDVVPTHNDGKFQNLLSPLQCLAIYSVFLASHVFLFIPAVIILIRVQASVYPMTEESIIPFERKGPLSVVAAWKTYSWEAKKRLFILYAKIMPMVWVAAIAVGTVLFFEMRWVMGVKGYILDTVLHTWLRNQNGPAP